MPMLAKMFMLCFVISVTTMAAPLREGPGRSGGGNGVFPNQQAQQPQGKLLDNIETANMVRIQNWDDEVPAFAALKKRLTRFPDLQAYLLDVIEAKPWYWTLQSLDEKSCYNATLGGQQKDVKIVACQWEDHGVLSAQKFQALSSEEQQQLLVHEGLVNHMVSVLNKLDKMASKESVDRRQKNIELEIHRLSAEIMAGKFKSTVEINKALNKLDMPVLVTEQEKEKLAKLDTGIAAKDAYVGGREKTDIMRRRFETAKPVTIAELRRRINSSTACMVGTDNYSVPGYVSGALMKLDENFPEGMFLVYAFRELEMDKAILMTVFNNAFDQRVAMLPLQERDGQLQGVAEIRPEEVFKQMLSKVTDRITYEEAKEIIKKQNPGVDFDARRRTRLTYRILENSQSGHPYIMIRREIFIYNGASPKLESEEYMAGELKSYPACMADMLL